MTEVATFLLTLVGVCLLVVSYKFHRKRDEVRRRREAIQSLMEDADLEKRGRWLKRWKDVRPGDFLERWRQESELLIAVRRPNRLR